MTFTCGADSSPRRRASVVSGNDAKALAVSSTASASPRAVPVCSAIHAAAERCPSSRHTVESAARLENRTLPAAPRRSISANSASAFGRLGCGDPVGVGHRQPVGDGAAGVLQGVEHESQCRMRVYQCPSDTMSDTSAP